MICYNTLLFYFLTRRQHLKKHLFIKYSGAPLNCGPPRCMDFGGGPTCQKELTSPVVAAARQVDVLHSQGSTIANAIRQIGVSEVTFYRWRKEYGGMKTDQQRLKELEKENKRLRRAVSDLTLDKLILKKAAKETTGSSVCVHRIDHTLQRSDKELLFSPRPTTKPSHPLTSSNGLVTTDSHILEF